MEIKGDVERQREAREDKKARLKVERRWKEAEQDTMIERKGRWR